MVVAGAGFAHINHFDPESGTIQTSLPQRRLKGTQSSKALTKQRKTQTIMNKHVSGGNKTMKGVMNLVRKAKKHGSSFSAKSPSERVSFGKATYAYSKGGASGKKGRVSRRRGSRRRGSRRRGSRRRGSRRRGSRRRGSRRR
jgi:phage-related tail protein